MKLTNMLPGRRSRAAKAKQRMSKTAKVVNFAMLAKAVSEITERRDKSGSSRKRGRLGALALLGGVGALAAAKKRRAGQPENQGYAAPGATAGTGPDVHTTAQEGHPAGDGERTDRDIGGPTSPAEDATAVAGSSTGASAGEGSEATGGATGGKPSQFEAHS